MGRSTKQSMQPNPLKAYNYDEMDVKAYLNLRNWLEKAITAKGAKMFDASIGAGQADIGFELEGMNYRVSIKPLAEEFQ